MIKLDFNNQTFYHPIVTNNSWFTTLDDSYLIGGERSPTSRICQINMFLNKLTDRPKTLLDIGCNIGLFCHYYAKTHSLQCTGVENNKHNDLTKWANQDNIKVANKLTTHYLSTDKPVPRFINDDYRNLCVAERFDIILYLSVWHHHMRNTYDQEVSKEKAFEYLYTVIDSANKYVVFEHDDKSGVPVQELIDVLKNKYGNLIEIQNPISIFDISRKNNYMFKRHLLFIKKIIPLNEKVTVCITTMHREQALGRCINSVISKYPDIKILVGNSSPNPRLTGWSSNVHVLHLPYYCGVSFSRNNLVQHVTTPYLVLIEDDMEFVEETDLQSMLNKIENTNYDMIGMTLIENERYRYGASNLIFKEGILKYQQLSDNSNYVDCDIILNAFIAKTSSVLQHPWDNVLKTYEHSIYFYDNWISKNPMKICLSKNNIIHHNHDSSDNVYNKMRRPSFELLNDALYKRSITKLIGHGSATYDSKALVLPRPDISKATKSEILKSVYDNKVNKLEIYYDDNYIWLPRQQGNFTAKGHLYGVDVERESYVLSGEILDKLIQISKSGRYPRNLVRIVGYDNHYMICERIKGMVLCNKNKFTPITDKLNPCYLDYDVKIKQNELMKPILDLHANGLCHTDVTEFNYMVSNDGRVYLIDLLSIVPFDQKYANLDYSCYNEMLSRIRKIYLDKII